MTSGTSSRLQTRPQATCTLIAALLAASAGCASGRIYGFAATPRRVCPATRIVTLTWNVEGRVSLSALPPLEGLGHEPSAGKKDIPAAARTVTLTASKFLATDVKSEQEITVFGAPEAIAIGPDATDVTCDEANREAVAVLAFEASEFDPLVRVLSLENAWDREVAVAHRGAAWTVRPRETVTLVPRAGLSPGVQPAGPWVLRAHLKDGETCGTPSARALLHITFNATIGCGGS